jgi:hypothetical protein
VIPDLITVTVFGEEQNCEAPPIRRVTEAPSSGVKRPRREADLSPQSSAEVKNAWSYTSTPPTSFHGVVLSEVQGQLYHLPSLCSFPQQLHFAFQIFFKVIIKFK